MRDDFQNRGVFLVFAIGKEGRNEWRRKIGTTEGHVAEKVLGKLVKCDGDASN